MEYLVVLITGLCIGSFLNVCIYRVPLEESIAFPGSHCFNCGYELKWYDLVPVLSYALLMGKCRKCKEKISMQYPLIEIANGLLYVAVFFKFGYSIDTLKFMTLVSLMIVIGMIDFKTKYVFTSTTIVGVIVGIVFIIVNWIITKEFPKDNVIGAIVGFVPIFLIVVTTHGMGEGDADIALLCGIFLGAKQTAIMLFFAIILGGIVAGIILLLKLKDKKGEMAFGPYLAIGSIISLFFGNELLNMYLNYYLL